MKTRTPARLSSTRSRSSIRATLAGRENRHVGHARRRRRLARARVVELVRHGRLKTGCLAACGFESRPGHRRPPDDGACRFSAALCRPPRRGLARIGAHAARIRAGGTGPRRARHARARLERLRAGPVAFTRSARRLRPAGRRRAGCRARTRSPRGGRSDRARSRARRARRRSRGRARARVPAPCGARASVSAASRSWRLAHLLARDAARRARPRRSSRRGRSRPASSRCRRRPSHAASRRRRPRERRRSIASTAAVQAARAAVCDDVLAQEALGHAHAARLQRARPGDAVGRRRARAPWSRHRRRPRACRRRTRLPRRARASATPANVAAASAWPLRRRGSKPAAATRARKSSRLAASRTALVATASSARPRARGHAPHSARGSRSRAAWAPPRACRSRRRPRPAG